MSDKDNNFQTDYSDMGYLLTSTPLVQQHVITLSEEVESPPFRYAELCNFLRYEVSEKDVVLLHLSNYGGDVNSSTTIVNALRDCKGFIKCIIEAPSYSAACDIALACDALELKPWTFLMFHNFSDAARGKGKELKDSVLNTDKLSAGLIKSLYMPFITKKEADDLINDKDLYVHWNDKDLDERIARHFGTEETEE